jgi:metal-responsive CopG/Arc/MetJ family transcriptional regulator
MRTIVDLPDEQIEALNSYSRREGVSRAEALRRAVAAFIPTKGRQKPDLKAHAAFGSSKRYRKEDSVVTVRRLRDEWR